MHFEIEPESMWIWYLKLNLIKGGEGGLTILTSNFPEHARCSILLLTDAIDISNQSDERWLFSSPSSSDLTILH